jgi:hypothetical protein
MEAMTTGVLTANDAAVFGLGDAAEGYNSVTNVRVVLTI